MVGMSACVKNGRKTVVVVETVVCFVFFICLNFNTLLDYLIVNEL